MTRLPLVDLDQLCHLIHSHHAEKQRAMVKTKIALLSVRSIVDNCLEAHGWFLWGLPGTGPSPCGQEVTKRKAAAIKIQSLLAKISCMYECLNRR